MRLNVHFPLILSVGTIALGSVPAVVLPELPLQTPVPLLNQILALLADPNVAYVLLVLGLLGLAGEVATGGSVFPGVTGVICLILALIGLGQLPTNWAGAALVLAAVVMFMLDFYISGFGLSIGGVVAFALGSLLLFTPPWSAPVAGDVRLNIWLVLATTGGVTAFFLLAIAAVMKSRSAPVAVGRHTLIGAVGVAQGPLAPRGIVLVAGETWSAMAVGAPIADGTPVEVVDVRGLVLYVRPATRDAAG
ncbi:MAG: NfeD family protein [Anaerolineae bacterium]